MNVCISIAEHEIEMAHRWFDFVCEFGGTDGHNLYLIPAAGLDVAALIPKANKSFNGRVTFIKDEEQQTSDWQRTEPMRSASGPNSAFRQIAWHFYHGKLGPYFWCELDCIPITKDWLDRLETEYKACGKPFMGAHVQIESVPEHMSGNAIYVNVPEEAPGLVQRTNWTPKGQSQPFELAFDIAGAKDVLPKAHFTNLIQHKFRFKGFESRSEFDAVIDPNAVVFHSDKKGTIYQYLRENLSGVRRAVGEESERLTNADDFSGERQEPTLPAQTNLEAGGSRHTDPGASAVSDLPTQTNLPVLVLAESEQSRCPPSVTVRGGDEARESTTAVDRLPPISKDIDSCGGQKPSSVPEVSNQIPASDKPKVESRTFTPSDDIETVIAQNSVIKNGLPAMSPPWENREDTEQDIRMLCNALALFCKAPIYKSRVRQALREAKIIK